jgi:serine/threonine protein kinase
MALERRRRDAMPILTAQERIGTTLSGKYQLGRIIGEGGMGVVFEAKHAWTERQVAVKLLHPAYSQDEELARRFLQEARTATTLRHPNVVEVLDMGIEHDGAVYIVLELLLGEPLSAVIARGALAPADTLATLLPVMGALASAHDKGFIHRDLKPDNIFLHRDNDDVVPKVLDFGIAKVLQQGHAQMTQAGMVVGTPHYISPEQATGSAAVGPASDVWAMGVVAYECLTGKVPFEGDTPTAVVVKVVTTHAPSVGARGDLHPALVRAVDHALSREASARYPHMRAFGIALAAAARAAGISVIVPRGFGGELDRAAAHATPPQPQIDRASLHLPVTTPLASEVTVAPEPPARTPLALVLGGVGALFALALAAAIVIGVVVSSGTNEHDAPPRHAAPAVPNDPEPVAPAPEPAEPEVVAEPAVAPPVETPQTVQPEPTAEPAPRRERARRNRLSRRW